MTFRYNKGNFDIIVLYSIYKYDFVILKIKHNDLNLEHKSRVDLYMRNSFVSLKFKHNENN